MRAVDLLGPDGPLREHLTGYEDRPAQLRMAELVERALTRDGVLLVEAGTGTGKTLAYLLPALLFAERSGGRVVISTGTKALQDQIMEQDLPFLEKALGVPLAVASMKGLSNYLCRRRYREFSARPEALTVANARALNVLDEWVGRSETGDHGELTELSEGAAIWASVRSSSETRIGKRCPYYKDCFVTQMKRRAEAAQIVVVNHHLFFADLATRGPHRGGVLPDYDAVIFDEAHQIEDVATLFFGAVVGRSRFDRLTSDIEKGLFAMGEAEGAALHLRELRIRAADFFEALPRPRLGALGGEESGRNPLPTDAFSGTRGEIYLSLDTALEALGAHLLLLAGKSEPLAQLCRRVERVRDELAAIVEGGRESNPDGRIAWVEASRGGAIKIGASPVEVSGLFREHVLERVPSVVLTSATLSIGGSFAHLKERLGVELEVDEETLPSPFDYPAQAGLYLPEVPDPRDPRFLREALEEIRALASITQGGGFVLCTSVRRMRELAEGYRAALRPLARRRRELAEALARSEAMLPGLFPEEDSTKAKKTEEDSAVFLPSRVLMQGEAPKGALLREFRARGDAMLFATATFWEGIDVPGEALRLVIIDRLPFGVPSDPLVAARCRRIEERGESAFMRYQVPSAALVLKQGFGRLIRSREDRGVVAILDSRIRNKGYGRVFLEALPPARRLRDREEVERFVESWPKRDPRRSAMSVHLRKSP